jgi:hypothetical protein
VAGCPSADRDARRAVGRCAADGLGRGDGLGEVANTAEISTAALNGFNAV